MKNLSWTAFSIVICVFFFSCSGKKEYKDEIYDKPVVNPDPQIKSLSREESLKSMYVPKGYTIEMIASEPLIHEPVTVAWDGNGKMYVAQMMTYMQDIDAKDEKKPWSRISILEDTTGDGIMDKSTVFIDSMVLPRIMLPLDDRVI